MIETKNYGEAWKGGDKPYQASYGKLMMWFFLITDALTFSAFLASYGFFRFTGEDIWPVPEEVFTHFPFLHGDHPLLFVALMTFILIMSSVTMVLAVNYGHKMQKNKVILWLSLTIIGGVLFLGSQAWEWGHFIHGDKGAIQISNERDIDVDLEIVHISKAITIEGKETFELSSVYELIDISHQDHHNFSLEEIIHALKEKESYGIRRADKSFLENQEALDLLKNNPSSKIITGANLYHNEYGTNNFGDCFFFITGFHGFHVFSGVIILIVILINVIKGTYERRGHYEMVEKVGLYWHFVDLVWVFVFTFFYLV